MINHPHVHEKELAPFLENTIQDEDEYEDLLIADKDFSNNTTKSNSFDRCIFRNVQFTSSTMKLNRVFDSIFEKCDFSNTNWEGVGLQRVEFRECRITGFNLMKAKIKDVVFTECKGEYCIFESLNAKHFAFNKCQIKFADFQNAYVPETTFKECDLSECEFAGAFLKDADLRTSIIDGLRISIKELQSIIVDSNQALYLAGMLGIKIL